MNRRTDTDPAQHQTLSLSSTKVADEQSRALTLTILCHPQLDRVGERARTSGVCLEVSRLEPDFVTPGSSAGLPLEDGYVSRKAILILAAGDGSIRIDTAGTSTEVLADGELVEGHLEIPKSRLDAGVVLLLARRVVLLLHFTSKDVSSPPSRHPESRVGLVGASSSVSRLRSSIEAVAGLEVSVLLRGETGTGKELVARALHEASSRRDLPVRERQHGGDPAEPGCGRALRRREGRLHGRRTGPTRVLPEGTRRHALPRRDRRDVSRRPGAPAAGARERRSAAGRRGEPRDSRRAHRRGHRPRPRGGGCQCRVPPAAAAPARPLRDPSAAASRPPGRHRPALRALSPPRAGRDRRRTGGSRGSEQALAAGITSGSHGVPELARQRPPATQPRGPAGHRQPRQREGRRRRLDREAPCRPRS